MRSQVLFYKKFFPDGRKVRFRKFRWAVMVLVQELMMGKYKAVLKFFVKPSYAIDIIRLCSILSKAPLTSRNITIALSEIHSSHEINYPGNVSAMVRHLMVHGYYSLPLLKVFYDEEKERYVVVDGNHRLKAMKTLFHSHDRVKVEVRLLEYRNSDN